MDAIQRKLALINSQLSGKSNFNQLVTGKFPALLPAIGLMCGIALQNFFTFPISLWLTILIIAALAAIVIFTTQLNNQLRFGIVYFALICFACFGAIRLTVSCIVYSNDISNLVTSECTPATIRGIISTAPYINENKQWQFSRFTHNDKNSSFYLKLTEAKTTDGWSEITGTVRVQINEPILDLKAGDYIQAYCWLDRFKKVTNPGQFDTAQYFARKNIFIAAFVQSRSAIELLQNKPAGTFAKLKRILREKTSSSLLGNISEDNTSRGLLEALLLGYRSNIDSNTYEAFRRTGLLHFISLSGMHLGILISVIWLACKTAGLIKKSRAAVCAIAIVIFLLIVPPRPPALRAAFIGFFFCASIFFRRHSNSINTLSLAAIMLLIIKPTNLFNAGWQLSFASVLGILLFTEPIEIFLRETITDKFWIKKIREKKFPQIMAKFGGNAILKLLSVGLAAWLGGAGILLYHFHTITPLSALWTVAVFPLVATILTVGYLKILLTLILPTIAVILNFVINSTSSLLILIVKFIAGLNISQILIGKISIAITIFYYCVILFAHFSYFKRPAIKKVICTVLIFFIVFFLLAAKWQRTHRNYLSLTCLDVGHGQAILAQLPGNKNILFDAGSFHRSDIGRKIVSPFLDYIGVDKIDILTASHNDIDHINGIPEVVEHCRVKNIYANKAFISEANKAGTAMFLKNCLSKSEFKIQLFDERLDLDNKAKIKIIWPTEQAIKNESLNDNNKSSVFLLSFAGKNILLCSDIERFAQREIIRLNPDLKADIVIVPHHGSANTLDTDFLEELKADFLIYSCSRKQYQRFSMTGSNYFYTAKDGAITICINKNGDIRSSKFVK